MKLNPVSLCKNMIHACSLGGHRVVGNIWCVGAGELSSHPVRDANSPSP